MTVVLAILGILAILLLAEYLARKTNMHAELTRKFVHMFAGSFIAFWPFFLTWRQIEVLSVMALIVILISIKFTIFKSIHMVPRQAVGEICFAMVIGLLALISSSEWIFMAAMLCLSIGDGLAAIIGLMWGDSNQYKVFGKVKSIAGTSAFFIVTVLVMVLYIALSKDTAGLTTLLIVPILATITENAAVNGTDNLVMPMLIALILGGSA